MTFRFDDVSINTDIAVLSRMVATIRRHQPHARIILAISPVVFSREQLASSDFQRVHPPRLTAVSALAPYYGGKACGLPNLSTYLQIIDFDPAGHGIVHVDHRLLSRDAQEISILVSCALAKAKVFVPPYNKWNVHTEDLCARHGIELIKFEDGWQHALHNRFSSNDPHSLYYLHSYDMSSKELDQWFAR